MTPITLILASAVLVVAGAAFVAFVAVVISIQITDHQPDSRGPSRGRTDAFIRRSLGGYAHDPRSNETAEPAAAHDQAGR